jgi:hypothetical protein
VLAFDLATLADLGWLLLGWATVAAVPLLFAVRWRRPTRPVAEFLVCLGLVSTLLVLVQARDMAIERFSGVGMLLWEVESNLLILQILTMPLLLLIGVDLIDFAVRAGEGTAAAARRLPRWALLLLLAGCLGWRLREAVLTAAERLGRVAFAPELLGYAGVLGEFLLVALVWWAVMGRSRRAGRAAPTPHDLTRTVERHALLVALAFSAPALLVSLLGGVGIAAALAVTMLLADGEQMAALARYVRLLDHLADQQTVGQMVVAALALVTAAWLTVRGRAGLALYCGLFGALFIWDEMTRTGAPLGLFATPDAALDDIGAVALLAAIGLGWWLRRQLTAARAGRLLALLVMTALLGQTDFLANPFNPALDVIGLSSIGVIAFGIVWDTVTAGAWANDASPALPRIGRLFLYLGYVLLSVTLILWAVAAHNLPLIEHLTGTIGQVGLQHLGRPLLYAIAAITLAAPPADDALPTAPAPRVAEGVMVR